ncbi:hypothetical protein IWX90DRAFT_426246 [Phyllosticta citrichinensis]|uniref:Secreted protein n=1 Tax=Phyllosticta citrichinensis TaxID=1130410 RepID=A0ABR1Y4Q3_9PEZI
MDGRGWRYRLFLAMCVMTTAAGFERAWAGGRSVLRGSTRCYARAQQQHQKELDRRLGERARPGPGTTDALATRQQKQKPLKSFRFPRMAGTSPRRLDGQAGQPFLSVCSRIGQDMTAASCRGMA